ncbi:glycosyltransferase family 39 protein [Arthrobacter sp. MSA 4-2]|uniref:ArnT family glycosyltransferase n=1 Tax=Arthrobacter sp. MSA 4-2 TaxID=2794349 RepID=UPI0018E8FD90|nr:glycosyltransferase family 39 protein [Arthrobacter sp. MSA 4-2]MBJ2122472.1 glycosyltransferase family 39 protein [Arthrobacter sp. MSA 4-2]
MTVAQKSTSTTPVSLVRPSGRYLADLKRLGYLLLRVIPLTLVLTLTAILYGVNLHGYPEFGNDDEGTYFAQAWSVANRGDVAHYTYWYDHPPVGWMQMAVLLQPLQWVWGGDGIPIQTAGRGMMTLIAVGSAALIYKISCNLGMAKPVALVAPLVWALSPLAVHYGRQIFLDNIALIWLLACFALITGKPKLHHHVAAGAAFGLAVLSKETAAVALPAILVALWVSSWPRTRAFSLVGFLGAGALLISGWVLFAIVKNELFPGPGHVSLWDAIVWQLHGRAGAGFIFADGSGANNILEEWLRQDPYLICAGMLLSLVGLFFRQARGIALVPVVYLVVALRGGYIPAMYIITPLPFFALIIVYLTWKLWQNASTRFQGAIKWPGRVVVAAVVSASVFVVTPSWAAMSTAAVTENRNASYQAALAFVDANLPRDTTVLTDDNVWNDMVEMGWNADGWSGPLWHFKLDRDPEAREKNLPGEWRQIDYIFLGRAMDVFVGGEILSKKEAPLAYAALSHSELVKAWGPVGRQVRLLKVNPDMEPVDPEWMRANPDQAPTTTISP